jgi:phage terminase large subunit-like protein
VPAPTKTRSRTPAADREPDPVAPLSPEIRAYLKARNLTVPRWCRPSTRTPEPRDVPGAVFSFDAVDRVVRALRTMRHTQGKWRGRPLEPDPWQVAFVLAPVFGWLAPNDEGIYVRIIRNAYVDLPRKNGKTTLAAGLALYLGFADGESGAQIVAVAASKDQARKCYDPAAQICKRSPQMHAAGVVAMRNRIVRQSDGSYFEVASALGDLLHGANVHGAVVDELHVHKTPDVLDAVESGTGAREQPLVIIITTPDDGTPHTVYANKRHYVDQLARGTFADPSQYGVVFGVRETDNPFAEATWRRANPGYGVAPTAEFMRAEARKARNSPIALARFQRLNLGIRTKQGTRFFTLSQWDRSAGMVREDRLAGRTAYGGLDLAATTDLAALCWLFPDDDGEGFDALWRIWTPESQVSALDKRTAGAASLWVKQGWLTTTPGDVIDYDVIKSRVLDDLDAFTVAGLGVDPWNATHLTNQLTGEGVPIASVRQGFVTLSPALKTVKRLLVSGTARRPLLRTGGNPVARWCADNLAVATDAAENVKPDKARATDKIDAISALVTAMALGMAHQPAERSAYAEHGMSVV